MESLEQRKTYPEVTQVKASLSLSEEEDATNSAPPSLPSTPANFTSSSYSKYQGICLNLNSFSKISES